MKKMIAFLLAAIMLLSLCACSGGSGSGSDKKAFENSQKAFNLITKAYTSTNRFSQDLYEAWRLGVNSPSSYDDDYEFDSFCDEMKIEQNYIEQAVANLLGKDAMDYGDWESLPYLYNGSKFSAWVSVISEAYACSGDVDEISEQLVSAKSLMKELSDSYSDYEHYPSLKKFFTNTLAFFDFCKNPEGTFEQVVDTFSAYRNNAREYFFDLNYVFADSIDGIKDITEETTASDEPVESTVGA